MQNASSQNTLLFNLRRFGVEVVIFGIYAIFSISWAATGSLMPEISKDLHLNTQQATLITSMIVVAKIFGSALMGFMIYHFGLKKGYFLCCLLISSGIFLSFIDSYGAILVIRFLMGLGSAAALGCLVPITQAWFEKKTLDFMISFNMNSNLVGITLGLVIASSVSQYFGDWRTSLAFYAWLNLALLILWLFVGKDDGHDSKNHSGEMQDLESKSLASEATRANGRDNLAGGVKGRGLESNKEDSKNHSGVVQDLGSEEKCDETSKDSKSTLDSINAIESKNLEFNKNTNCDLNPAAHTDSKESPNLSHPKLCSHSSKEPDSKPRATAHTSESKVPQPTHTTDSKTKKEELLTAFKSRLTWGMVVFYAGPVLFLNMLFTFLPTFYAEYAGFSQDLAQYARKEIPAIANFAIIFGPYLGLYFKRKKISFKIMLIIGGMILLISGLCMLFLKDLMLIRIFAVLSGLFYSFCFPFFFNLPSELKGSTPSQSAYIMSIFWTFNFIILSINLWFVSWSVDHTHSFTLGFTYTFILIFISVMLAQIIFPKREHFVTQ